MTFDSHKYFLEKLAHHLDVSLALKETLSQFMQENKALILEHKVALKAFQKRLKKQVERPYVGQWRRLTGLIEAVPNAVNELVKVADAFEDDFLVNMFNLQLEQGHSYFQAISKTVEAGLLRNDLNTFDRRFLIGYSEHIHEHKSYHGFLSSCSIEKYSPQMKTFFELLKDRHSNYSKMPPRKVLETQELMRSTASISQMWLWLHSFEQQWQEGLYDPNHDVFIMDALKKLTDVILKKAREHLLACDTIEDVKSSINQWFGSTDVNKDLNLSVDCQTQVTSLCHSFKNMLAKINPFQEGDCEWGCLSLGDQYQVLCFYAHYNSFIDALKNQLLEKAFALKTTEIKKKTYSAQDLLYHVLVYPYPNEDLRKEEALSIKSIFAQLRATLLDGGWKIHEGSLLQKDLLAKLDEQERHYLEWQTYLGFGYPQRPLTLQAVFNECYHQKSNDPLALLEREKPQVYQALLYQYGSYDPQGNSHSESKADSGIQQEIRCSNKRQI